jgi:hypothetical protein
MRKKDEPGSLTSELILYQTQDGKTKIEVRLQDENVWLTQKLMAELFQTTPQNITIHLKNIFNEGELNENATCKDFLQVQIEGNRQVEQQFFEAVKKMKQIEKTRKPGRRKNEKTT